MIKELVNRPIIRDDHALEFMNKMTDEEIEILEHDIKIKLIKDKVPEKFPDWNSAYLCAVIDKEALYQLFKKSEYEAKKGV